MKLSKSLLLTSVLTTLLATTVNAQQINDDLGQAYLAHWFSIDSAEQVNGAITRLAKDVIGDRAELHFKSDDGQNVNGLIAYPADRSQPKKLALVLHPMGVDQQFWWSSSSPLASNKLTEKLRESGYTVISLDARRHGARATEGFGPRELLARAHSTEPRLYIETIIGSVRDYRTVLKWAETEFQPKTVMAVGYSMGAQMSLLLASYEPSIDTVLAMVPPYVGSPTSPVAPRIHAHKITDAEVLWLAGRDDPHSNSEQTKKAFGEIASSNKKLIWFDGGHRLPPEYLLTALDFFSSLQTEVK